MKYKDVRLAQIYYVKHSSHHLPLWRDVAGYGVPMLLEAGEPFVVLCYEPDDVVILSKLGIARCYQNHVIESAGRNSQ